MGFRIPERGGTWGSERGAHSAGFERKPEILHT